MCVIGHMTEVGGMVPGGFAGDATEVFQEGIRFPPVKIIDRGNTDGSLLIQTQQGLYF